MLGGLGPPCRCLREIMVGKVTASSASISLVATPIHYYAPHPPSCRELEQVGKVWRVHKAGSSELPCHSRLPVSSAASNPCKDGHGTTIGSGHRTPSTHPSAAQLVRHQVNASSNVPSDASLSHSNKVSSTRVDWVAPSSEVDSLPPRGLTSPFRVATRKSQLQWSVLTLLPSSHTSYAGMSSVT